LFTLTNNLIYSFKSQKLIGDVTQVVEHLHKALSSNPSFARKLKNKNKSQKFYNPSLSV
jgi:hypothetical protein